MSGLDNELLINMKIQEQMKRYEQNKQKQLSQDELLKNQVKQQVWEQLFNPPPKPIAVTAIQAKQSTSDCYDFKPVSQLNYAESALRPASRVYKPDDCESQIWEESQVKPQASQLSRVTQKHSITRQSEPSQSIFESFSQFYPIKQAQMTQQYTYTPNHPPRENKSTNDRWQPFATSNKPTTTSNQEEDMDSLQPEEDDIQQQSYAQEYSQHEQSQSSLSQLYPQVALHIKDHYAYEAENDSQQWESSFPAATFSKQPQQHSIRPTDPNKQQLSSQHYQPEPTYASYLEHLQASKPQTYQTDNDKQHQSYTPYSDHPSHLEYDDELESQVYESFANEHKLESTSQMRSFQQTNSSANLQDTRNPRLLTTSAANDQSLISKDEGWDEDVYQIPVNFPDEEQIEEPQEENQNKFIQFEIGLDQSDVDFKRRKFELVRKKKLEEMEKAKNDRERRKFTEQSRDKETEFYTPVNKSTPKRERSPLMPSASVKSKDQQESKYLNQQRCKTPPNITPKSNQNKGNIFSEDAFEKTAAFLPPKQFKKEDIPLPQPRQNTRQSTNSIKQNDPTPDRNRPVSGVTNKSRNNSTQKIIQKQEPQPQMTLKSKKNNKQMLRNAITNVCLAGDPNKKEREAILAQLESVEAEHFIILLKGQFGRMDFKALYGMSAQDQLPELLFQTQRSPPILDPSLVLHYFKYDSGAKEFKPISGNKYFSYIIDAVKLKK